MRPPLLVAASADRKGDLIRPDSDWIEGVVDHLHVAPRAAAPMQRQSSIELVAGRGVAGDRYQLGIEQGFYSRRPEPGRQVTLFEAEVLELLAREHGIALAPAEHRRNITTRGVALAPLVGRQFRIGECLLEATRLSVPCRHLDELLGRPVFDALVGRAGLNCVIVHGGTVRVGDPVTPR